MVVSVDLEVLGEAEVKRSIESLLPSIALGDLTEATLEILLEPWIYFGIIEDLSEAICDLIGGAWGVGIKDIGEVVAVDKVSIDITIDRHRVSLPGDPAKAHTYRHSPDRR